MERGDYAPEFPLQWAVKDVDLALAEAGDSLPLLAALSRQWHVAVDAGHGRAGCWLPVGFQAGLAARLWDQAGR
jgi:3-hydroxyisobutyrate dehydrogenase-like beta-hydroxyacid dehydrogenase